MRISEWINVGCFSFFIILLLLRPPCGRRRAVVVGICSIAIGTVIAAAQFGRHFFTPLTVSVIRDWLPAALLLLPYWVAGLFFTRANEQLQSRLLRIDHVLSKSLQPYWPRGRARLWLLTYLETAYALCYAVVPLGIAVLYLAHKGAHADRFWSGVLPPTYTAFAALPFFPTLPPRALELQQAAGNPEVRLRHLNLWVLNHASIRVNTFPSGHVAASVSTALAILPLMPIAGLLFVLVAISIALGAVIGRYHYAADALIAAVIALAINLLEYWLCWH